VPRTLDDTSIRRLRALWVIQGRVRLSSAAHFGGNDDGPADAMIVGMYQQFGDQVGENAAMVRELCGKKR
jgi:hypothetical protein